MLLISLTSGSRSSVMVVAPGGVCSDSSGLSERTELGAVEFSQENWVMDTEGLGPRLTFEGFPAPAGEG